MTPAQYTPGPAALPRERTPDAADPTYAAHAQRGCRARRGARHARQRAPPEHTPVVGARRSRRAAHAGRSARAVACAQRAPAAGRDRPPVSAARRPSRSCPKPASQREQ
jgi:hypothetical protein